MFENFGKSYKRALNRETIFVIRTDTLRHLKLRSSYKESTLKESIYIHSIIDIFFMENHLQFRIGS